MRISNHFTLDVNSILHNIGNVLFFLLIFVIMLDPTNTVLHKKDIIFVIVVFYNICFFKPDWSKLPLILAMFCAVAVPWIFSIILGVRIEDEDVIAVFKSISPTILLLWCNKYNLVSLSRGPVILCSLVVMVLYLVIMSIPDLEGVIYAFFIDKDEPILMSRRTILGVQIFGMYLKSIVSFLFVLTYYFYVNFTKGTRKFTTVLFLIIILFAFFVSGTRSTMIVPIFIFLVVGFKSFYKMKYAKYILYPLIIIIGITFIVGLYVMASEKDEYSNAIKYAHIGSYIELFCEHPIYLFTGEGPGSTFYSEGFGKVVKTTEWTYIELVRYFGVFSLIIIGVFYKPLVSLWKYSKSNDFVKCMFWAYLAYLLIAGTNPLMLSSTGMIMLLMAYSYVSSLDEKNKLL
jgi:hypothetical protein